MIIKTGRFGQLGVEEDEIISMPQGILGFPEYKRFCLVDPGDDTLILWLQSLENPEIAFPILEPKIFKPDYAARLSAVELRELKTGKHQPVCGFQYLDDTGRRDADDCKFEGTYSHQPERANCQASRSSGK